MISILGVPSLQFWLLPNFGQLGDVLLDGGETCGNTTPALRLALGRLLAFDGSLFVRHAAE